MLNQETNSCKVHGYPVVFFKNKVMITWAQKPDSLQVSRCCRVWHREYGTGQLSTWLKAGLVHFVESAFEMKMSVLHLILHVGTFLLKARTSMSSTKAHFRDW